MRILFENIIKDADISSLQESLNYPASNLSHPYIKKRYQSNGSITDTITILFAEDRSANCIFYGNHNLTDLVIRLKDSGGITILTINITDPTDGNGREYFSTFTNIRSIEIDVTGPSPAPYLGGFAAGIYYQNINFLTGYPEGAQANWGVNKSPSGQTNVNNVKPLREFSFQFRERTKEDKDEFLSLIDENGPGPHWHDLTECDINFLPIQYATIVAYPGMQRNGRRYDNNLSIQESR